MSMDTFQRIWYMEYAHRMWGCLIGVAFVFPALYFLLRRRVDKKFKPVGILHNKASFLLALNFLGNRSSWGLVL